jgi:hypothetical protein
MAVMRKYDLSEEKAHEIRMQLEARRGVRATSGTSTIVREEAADPLQ